MLTRAPLHLLLGIGGVCALSSGTNAFAQGAGEALPVVVSGGCPEAGAVMKVLATLLPVGGSASSTSTPTSTPSVADLGDSYRVTVGGRAKTYADAGRNCAERARVAAAFIALALAPDVQPPTPRAVPVPPAPLPTPPAPPPPVRRSLRTDARGSIAVAPGDGLVAPGAELGFAAGWAWLGGHVECGWSAASSLDLSTGGSILIERFPCALGPMARVFPGQGRLEVEVDPGVALGAVIATGRGLATTSQSVRLELGARLAADVTWHFGPRRSSWGPVLGLEGTVYPAPYDLDVTGRGTVARTPSFWAGFTAGVCWTVE